MVDVLDRLDLRIGLRGTCRRTTTRSPGRQCGPSPRTTAVSLARPSSVVPGRGNSSRSRAMVPSALRIGDHAPVEATLLHGGGGALLARRRRRRRPSSRSKPSIVAIRSAETPCGTSGNRSRSDGLPAVKSRAPSSAGQRDIDSTPPRDDEILVAGLDAHGGKRDRLLSRPAEAVERDARRLDRPAGGEDGHASDAHALVADRVAVADDHVVDVGRRESRVRPATRSGPGRGALGDGCGAATRSPSPGRAATGRRR